MYKCTIQADRTVCACSTFLQRTPESRCEKMAPKSKNKSPPSDPDGMFSGMVVFLIETSVQPRRLQIWKQKLTQMGAEIEVRFSKRVTHIFAADSNSLLQKTDRISLKGFKGSILNYQWLEDSLRLGEKASVHLYLLSVDTFGENYKVEVNEERNHPEHINASHSSIEYSHQRKKIRTFPEEFKAIESIDDKDYAFKLDTPGGLSHSLSPETMSPSSDSRHADVTTSDTSLLYIPPDLNRNITDIFGKLINIYRALGDDRRSFSYHKAIPVIEKLPFRIESADQVKDLPGIGKSLQDHIQEIVNTGKLSKLEHFEKDEKVHTINLFGEVWGIGPATAVKFYEKGYRTLDDLEKEESLSNAQKLGLKYFDDIKTRIPRHDVQEMESMIQKAGAEILPGVVIVCGGSYRRGKASCGDMDIVITHPDGKSHIGFLPKLVKCLKDINFLREDLIFSVHSEEGTDSGVDTYFGLCTYPGQELRRRIDLKVYPRDIYAFGLVAWTGNDVLNRRFVVGSSEYIATVTSLVPRLVRIAERYHVKNKLRLLAESKRFRLDDTGLFPASLGSGGKRGSRGSASLKFGTEKEVFDFLGFPWLEPHHRNL